MNQRQAPLDDGEILAKILSEVDVLLLDFDGPVCSVFAGLPAPVVADQLREILSEGGHANLPPEVRASEDPFDVFAYAAEVGASEARYVESALRALEVEAVASSSPTPGTHELMRAWSSTGRTLAIVSNNSSESVKTYLHSHGLHGFVSEVSARAFFTPELLKPNPYLVKNAITAVGADPKSCVLIGDSVSDMQAANLIEARTIGYANRPSKSESLKRAGAEAITLSMEALLRSLI